MTGTTTTHSDPSWMADLGHSSPDVAVSIGFDDDASPVVRLVARTLRDATEHPALLDLLRALEGTISLQSHDTPQRATITFHAGEVNVTAGASSPTVLTVDLGDRFAIVDSKEGALTQGSNAFAADVLRVLTPPLPPWSRAADRFKTATEGIRGMPARLVVICTSSGETEKLTLGEGEPQYTISGEAESLSRVFSGELDLLTAVFGGVLKVRGTLPQLSAMAGASWKVRFDV